MATTKPPALEKDISHIEHHPTSPTHPINTLADDEEIKGRDFTVEDNELPPGYFKSFSFIGSMFAIGLSFACGVGGFTLPAPVLGFINADLGPDVNITWVALAYLLTTSIGLIIVGRITDIFGRRWFFIIGCAVATLGSIVCATAPSVPALIAGETLIGIGSSVQLSYAFVVSEIVPTKWRLLSQGYVFLWGIPSSGLAPIVSYAFVFKTDAGWRGIYYLLIAMNAASTLAFYLCYRPPSFAMKHGSARKKEFIKHFDYIGTLVLTLGLLLFLMGLSWGGVLHPWKSAHVVCTIVLGALLVIAFFVWEACADLKEPLLPMRLLKNRGWNVTVILWALGAAVYYANAILWPSMVATMFASGHSNMWAGALSCLPNCGILFGEYCGAWGKRKTNLQIIVAFTVGAIFLGCMATSTPDTVIRSSIFIFLASTFVGWNEILNSTVATITIDDQREIGTATGAAGSARSLISTICSTVYTVVLSNRLLQTVPNKVPPALIKAGLPATSVPSFLAAIAAGTASAFAAVPGLTPAIQKVGTRAYQEATSDAYNTVFLSTIAFSGVGVILSFFAPNVDHLLTKNVTVTLHEKNTDVVVGGLGKGEKDGHLV